MKRIFGLFGGAVLTFVLSSGAFAATVSKTLTLDNPVQVNGTTLQPGDYKVSYDDSTPNTQVTFQKGKEKIATVPAQIKPLGSKTNSTALVINTQGSTATLD